MTGAPASRVWRCGSYELALDRPLVMGILNVTPDSFSDGGRWLDPLAAVEKGRALALAGADIIDVGGESTRPGSEEVPVAEELDRVAPVVSALVNGLDIPVSIDTRHAEVAEACLDQGASIINDVSGFRDPVMVALAAACDAGLVAMHMLGEPKTMQVEPAYDDVVAEVRGYLGGQAAMLEAAGVGRQRIALDPGIGFGKTLEHNLALLRGLPQIASLGYPVLVGASRKRFIGDITGEVRPDRRLAGSVAVAVWAALHGAHIVRVHDVVDTVQALRTVQAIRGASHD